MIRIRATSATRKRIPKIILSEDTFRRGLRYGLFSVGKDAALDAGRLINNDARTGRVYLIDGLPHVSSAAGEAPANMSGALRRAMNYVARGSEEVEWGSTIVYGRYLEEGTSKMRPRPFLKKIFDKNGGKHARDIGERVRNEIKRRS